MGDMGDDFRAYKKASQEKRAGNRDSSSARLSAAGVSFEARNLGAHLIVDAGEEKINFWPGTGLWMVVGKSGRERGVKSLIQYVKSKK